MKRLLLLVLVVACKSDSASSPPPAPTPAPTVAKRTLGLVAEVRGSGILVTGTRRFAIFAEGWHVLEGGKLVDKPEIYAAISRAGDQHGLFDILVGTTPIVIGGEDHQEKHVRITPQPVEVAIDGLASEIVTVGSSELWRYTHELQPMLAVVDGTTVKPLPPLERIGAASKAASPVSERLCRHPKIVDIAASATSAFALVTECNDDAPIRITRYFAGATELRLPSRNALGVEPQILAVSRDGTPVIVGVRGSQLAVVRADGTVTAYDTDIARVIAAVVDDDGVVWAKAVDQKGDPILLRDGKRVALANPAGAPIEPKRLEVDDTLGVIVYAGALEYGPRWLFAERPPTGDPITIGR